MKNTSPIQYKVRITYFKSSGKYYSEGEYKTETQELHKIWQEFASMTKAPGLKGDGKEFYALVEVPGHPHDHPILMHPGRNN